MKKNFLTLVAAICVSCFYLAFVCVLIFESFSQEPTRVTVDWSQTEEGKAWAEKSRKANEEFHQTAKKALAEFRAAPAESTEVATWTDPSEGTEGTKGTTGANPVNVAALVAVIVPVLLAFVKPRLPIKWRKYLPLVAPILGEIITQSFTALPNGLGAIAGLGGVGVREAVKRKSGIPSPNITYPGANYLGLVGTLALPLFTMGCAGGGIKGVAQALSKDQAIVIVKVRTIYGTGELTRIGGSTNAVSISPDGTVHIHPGTNVMVLAQTNFYPVFLRAPGTNEAAATNAVKAKE